MVTPAHRPPATHTCLTEVPPAAKHPWGCGQGSGTPPPRPQESQMLRWSVAASPEAPSLLSHSSQTGSFRSPTFKMKPHTGTSCRRAWRTTRVSRDQSPRGLQAQRACVLQRPLRLFCRCLRTLGSLGPFLVSAAHMEPLSAIRRGWEAGVNLLLG